MKEIIYLNKSHRDLLNRILNDRIEKSINDRIEIINLNKDLKKEKRALFEVPPVYNLKLFASDLDINYNSFRKFMSGHKCNIGIEILQNIDEVHNMYDVIPKIEKRLVPVCTCGEVHTLKRCPNKRKSKPQESRWRTKPPPCPECGEDSIYENYCELCGHTLLCQIRTQYKY